jgi:hypothetical protein
MQTIGGGAAARPDADGGTACLANIVRTGAPHGAAPPHTSQFTRRLKYVQVVTGKTPRIAFPPGENG